jgi:ribonucleoside-diphosphate reductase alpha chain
LWEIYQNHWCEHKPSVTIYYSDAEFLAAGQWLWDRLDECSGISFLPRTDHVYQQAPYEAVDIEQYKELKDKMPKVIDWSSMIEVDDNTVGTQELACSAAGGCEI